MTSKNVIKLKMYLKISLGYICDQLRISMRFLIVQDIKKYCEAVAKKCKAGDKNSCELYKKKCEKVKHNFDFAMKLTALNVFSSYIFKSITLNFLRMMKNIVMLLDKNANLEIRRHVTCTKRSVERQGTLKLLDSKGAMVK